MTLYSLHQFMSVPFTCCYETNNPQLSNSHRFRAPGVWTGHRGDVLSLLLNVWGLTARTNVRVTKMTGLESSGSFFTHMAGACMKITTHLGSETRIPTRHGLPM